MSRSSKAAALAAEQALAAQQQSAAPKDIDAPSCIQDAVLDAYKKTQKAAKEAKGLASSSGPARSFGGAMTTTASSVGGMEPRHVSFHASPDAGSNRADARLGFIGEDDDSGDSAAAAAVAIQPHQYPKLFSHSGFSPAAEEVFYNTAAVLNKNVNSSSRNKSKKKRSSRSASPAGSETSATGSTTTMPSSSSRPRSAEERKAASRRAELKDPIFMGTALCSDAGFLAPLAEQCMALRSSSVSEKSAPPTIEARLNEVDQHALVTVGACLPSSSSAAQGTATSSGKSASTPVPGDQQQQQQHTIETVVAALVEPYKGQTWKLSHLEATLCRIRAIYRWITAFVKLDAPPVPQLLAVALAAASDAAGGGDGRGGGGGGGGHHHQYSGHQQGSSALASREEGRHGSKGKGHRKVVVSAPSAKAAAAAAAAGAGGDKDGGAGPGGALAALNTANLLGDDNLRAVQQVAVPKFFPYKYVDCDDAEDATYMKNEILSALETLPANLQVTNLSSIIGKSSSSSSSSSSSNEQQQKGDASSFTFPAPGSYSIGEETANAVFSTRVGDCHQVAALFSYMVRHKAARILPESADATDFFATLGVEDTAADAMHAVSSRKTVAGPTGRAAAKCEAAPSPNAARAREKSEKLCGGGDGSSTAACEVVTARGTIKGCTGENGKPAGYLPWSWSVLSLPDGRRYVLDVAMSMAQVTERFQLSMGALSAVMEEKRRSAFLASVQQLAGFGGQQQQQQGQAGAISHSGGGGGGRKRGETIASKAAALLKEQQQQQQQSNPNEAALQLASQATAQPMVAPSGNAGPGVFLSTGEVVRISAAVVAKPVDPSSNSIGGSNNSSSSFPTFSNYADAPLALNAPSLDAHTAAMHMQWVPPGTSTDSSSQQQQQQQQKGSSSSGDKKDSSKPTAGVTTASEAGAAAAAAAPPAPVFPPQQQLLSTSPASLLVRSFIPFFFFTNPTEFAVSHHPRQPQHLLVTSAITAKQQQQQQQQQHHTHHGGAGAYLVSDQPSRGVVKPPFTQGAWESYPRLSHRFLELGMRLKSRARRSVFSIPGPPEYLSVEAPCCPERIETKAFIFKCSSYALSAMASVAPAMQPLVVPMTYGALSSSSSLQQQQQSGGGHHQSRRGGGGGGSGNDSGAGAAGGGGGGAAAQEATQAAIQARQQTVLPFAASSSSSKNADQQQQHQFTTWIQDQQQHLARYWSALGPGGARLATAPFSVLPRTWAAASYQRATGVFTHTLAMPDVGVYTVVIGVREINPSTGRPVEPFFTPAVQYQVTCSFVQSPDAPVAVQREATLAKVVRPLVSKLPAVAAGSPVAAGSFYAASKMGGIPFVVAPLFPRVRGIAVVNAVEKKKQKPTRGGSAGASSSSVPNLPAIGAVTAKSTTPSSNTKLSKQEQAAAANEAARLQQQQAAAAAAASATTIERVDVHLLQWDPASACFRGDVPLEPGHVGIWCIVENIAGDTTVAAAATTTGASTTTSNTQNAASSLRRGGTAASAGASTGKNAQQQLESTTASGRDSPSDETDVLLQKLTDQPGRAPPRGALALSISLAAIQQQVPDAQQALQLFEAQRQQLLSSQPSVFSRFNPLCLPQQFEARGLEQMMKAVVPPPMPKTEEIRATPSSSTTTGGRNSSAANKNNKSPSRGRTNARTGKKHAAAASDTPPPAAATPPNRKLEEFITEISVAKKQHASSVATTEEQQQQLSAPTTPAAGHREHHHGKKGDHHHHQQQANAAALLLEQQQKDAAAAAAAAASASTAISVSVVPLWTGISVQSKVPSKEIMFITNGAGFGEALGVPESMLNQMMASSSSSSSVAGGATSFRRSSSSGDLASSSSGARSSSNLLASLSVPSGAGGGGGGIVTGVFGEQINNLVYPVRMDLDERNAVNLALCGKADQRVMKRHEVEVGKHFLCRK